MDSQKRGIGRQSEGRKDRQSREEGGRQSFGRRDTVRGGGMGR